MPGGARAGACCRAGTSALRANACYKLHALCARTRPRFQQTCELHTPASWGPSLAAVAGALGRPAHVRPRTAAVAGLSAPLRHPYNASPRTRFAAANAAQGGVRLPPSCRRALKAWQRSCRRRRPAQLPRRCSALRRVTRRSCTPRCCRCSKRWRAAAATSSPAAAGAHAAAARSSQPRFGADSLPGDAQGCAATAVRRAERLRGRALGGKRGHFAF